jgi:AcrR family transcriptional regulator
MGEAHGDTRSATRDALIRVATRLWYESGYERVSVQEIVEAAGLTKGAFYHYFDSKEELLKLIHDDFIEQEIAAVRSAIEHGGSPSNTLVAIIVELLNSVANYREGITVFFREMPSLSEQSFNEVKSRRDFLGKLVLSVIHEGIDAGEFREVRDEQLVMFAIIGMCAWAHEWFEDGAPLSAREIGEMYAGLLLDGLRHS